jgi:hypothetical protein
LLSELFNFTAIIKYDIMRKSILISLLILISFKSKSQNVGIGIATPQQRLHVAGAGQTIRVDGLSGVGTRLVYANAFGDLTNTAGSPAPAWLILGNDGTNASNHFIGTTDAIDFVGRTSNIERFRVSSTGQFNVNRATFIANDVFAAFGNGIAGAINTSNNFAINGYVNNAGGAGVYGENASGTAIFGLSNTLGVYGQIPVAGLNTSNALWGNNLGVGVAVRGQAVNPAGGIGVIGFTAVQAGVQGQCASTGDGVRGFNTLNGANAGDGVYGEAAYGGGGGGTFPSSLGVFGYNLSPTGIGVCGGTVGPVFIPTAGSGGSFSGSKFGVAGFVNRDTTLNGTNTSAGGYFYCNAGALAYVGARINGTNYKITGTGTAGTFVRDLNNEYRIMACPEAPEILFQDYGVGQLINGEAFIQLDPIFTKNIVVNEQHPLKVFIQLEDECNGVFVTNKSSSGFKVKELANGNSNAKFSWCVVANRSDEKDLNGNIISSNENWRFPLAPAPEGRTIKPAKANAHTEELLNPPVYKQMIGNQ